MPTDDRTSLESNLFALTVFIARHLTDGLYLARYCRPGRRRHRVLCRCSVVSGNHNVTFGEGFSSRTNGGAEANNGAKITPLITTLSEPMTP
ncbi:hypothetical protein E3C29_02420 [Salmonella enterica subsp. enterica]|nr:hypothetical protein [Salmonella enterica subsp. enterica]